MTCDHHLGDDPTALPCTRPDPHTTGHTYTDPNGSDLNDRHGEQGHG